MENKNIKINTGNNKKDANQANLKKTIIIQKFKNKNNTLTGFPTTNICGNKRTVNIDRNMPSDNVRPTIIKKIPKNNFMTKANNIPNDENKNIINLNYPNRNVDSKQKILLQKKLIK